MRRITHWYWGKKPALRGWLAAGALLLILFFTLGVIGAIIGPEDGTTKGEVAAEAGAANGPHDSTTKTAAASEAQAAVRRRAAVRAQRVRAARRARVAQLRRSRAVARRRHLRRVAARNAARERRRRAEQRRRAGERRRAAAAAAERRRERAVPPAPAAPSCEPGYSPCLKPDAGDYDCEGGSGDGPNYTGPVTVNGPDTFDLDRDGDGTGCDS